MSWNLKPGPPGPMIPPVHMFPPVRGRGDLQRTLSHPGQAWTPELRVEWSRIGWWRDLDSRVPQSPSGQDAPHFPGSRNTQMGIRAESADRASLGRCCQCVRTSLGCRVNSCYSSLVVLWVSLRHQPGAYRASDCLSLCVPQNAFFREVLLSS